MDIWFTGCSHWAHANILKYCDRPFATVQEHDEALIENWNSVVKPDDWIFHLGDFGFGSKSYLGGIVKRLQGIKYFVRGNHDKSMKGDLLRHFQFDKLYHELVVDDEEMDITQNIILCHYPFESWNKKHFGSFHLHSHCHGTFDERNESMARLDVGVDSHNYFPVSYERVKEIMTRRMLKNEKKHDKRKDTPFSFSEGNIPPLYLQGDCIPVCLNCLKQNCNCEEPRWTMDSQVIRAAEKERKIYDVDETP